MFAVTCPCVGKGYQYHDGSILMCECGNSLADFPTFLTFGLYFSQIVFNKLLSHPNKIVWQQQRLQLTAMVL